MDILEEFGGYVAGVANPRFEELPHTWDILCNLETGKVSVSKDLKSVGAGGGGGRKRDSDTSLGGSIVQVDGESAPNTPAVKMSSASRPDCTDNQFMEEVSLFFDHAFLVSLPASLPASHFSLLPFLPLLLVCLLSPAAPFVSSSKSPRLPRDVSHLPSDPR